MAKTVTARCAGGGEEYYSQCECGRDSFIHLEFFFLEEVRNVFLRKMLDHARFRLHSFGLPARDSSLSLPFRYIAETFRHIRGVELPPVPCLWIVVYIHGFPAEWTELLFLTMTDILQFHCVAAAKIPTIINESRIRRE
jgi:hypothetical protein